MILENNIKQNLLNNNDQKGNHDYDNVNNHQTIQLCCYGSINDNKIDNLYKLLIKQLKSRTFIVGYVTFINSSCNGLLLVIMSAFRWKSFRSRVISS